MERERSGGSSRLCPDSFASLAVSAREGRKGRIFGQKKALMQTELYQQTPSSADNAIKEKRDPPASTHQT